MNVQLDLGVIRSVVLDPERGVFVDVDLAHHSRRAGGATTARCRMLQPYHGPGFGEWWVPEPGLVVLCFFPGLGLDGSPGGDIDEGVALGVLSTLPAPPVDGIAGALAATRRVFRGKPGVAYDEHLQGTLDRKVDGVENAESVGVVNRLFRALARFVGDVELRLAAPLVRLGSEAAVRKIVHDAMIGLYNGHVHSGVQSGSSTTGPPVQQMVEDVHTSTKARVDD